ncbi:GNAT family N-acetyltransferase [Seonamhaeicola sp.]|uniref:GNAT family N-acetyltransferase n=1 Tax=Seonamhaeicola sp. TaxID=1912245 RepID=UPI0026249427|nr:GNAT family N-acetyltransferase [Seonamhaeicola sp.]
MSYLIHKRNIYKALFEEQELPTHIRKVAFNTTDVSLPNLNRYQDKIGVFNLYPDYLKLTTPDGYHSSFIYQKPGFAINLKPFDSFEGFVKQLKPNFRKVVRRSVKRLESCFNISYQMYYGDIDKTTYNLLMERLIDMIEQRFSQREGRNRVLEEWDYYHGFAYANILNKKASLFVIYNENEPIEISLNFHLGNMMYSSISSYDLDYGKFSLGNIEIFMQLEWCFNNDIILFDMGYGDFDYKRRWSNLTYQFKTLIISKKNNFISKTVCFWNLLKFKTINYLIAKKLNNRYNSLLGFLKGKKETKVETEYTLSPIDELPEDVRPIDFKSFENPSLKKPIYDFLYSNSEFVDKVKAYSILSDTNSFIIEGSKINSKITFENASN